jgi:flagellar biosynthesis protein FlhB
MSIGRVFQRAFSAISANPVVILGLSLIVGAVPSLVLNFAVGALGLTGRMTAATFSITALLGFLLTSVLITIIVSSFAQAAITRATVSASEGRKASLGQCLATAFAVFVPLIAMAILSGIAIAIGICLLIVPGVILFLMWSVASPTLVIERPGIIGALQRSAELTKGSRWKILGMFLVFLIAYWVLSLIVGAVGLTMYNPGSFTGLTASNLIGSIVLGTVLNAAAGTMWPSLYVELRQIKEGGSLENLHEVFA